jgi:hypothetical protein
MGPTALAAQLSLRLGAAFLSQLLWNCNRKEAGERRCFYSSNIGTWR